MDAVNDAQVDTIVIMSSAQVGKTEILNNIVGYFIDQDPSPMLVMQPTVEMAETWSKDRLAPMLRDTPALAGKVADPKSRNSGNTILHKQFPGGHITMVGANAPSALASRPIRVVLGDEVDRYPVSAGTEGDPVSLARKRTARFWNRKIILTSTPTITGLSRIEAAFLDSDQRHFWVPCADCGEPQVLTFDQVKWQNSDPATALYACAHCGVLWDDAQRWRAVSHGEWRASAPFKGVAGFHISEIYSTWSPLADMVREFLAAKDSPELLKVWVNTSKGESFAEKGEAPEWRRLYERREDWTLGTVPMGGLFLTAGVDVQKDRLECYVWAWGRGRESWLVDHIVIAGDTARPETFDALTEVLGRTWPHACGANLSLSRLAIDSGYATVEVYSWARRARDRRVMVVKGVDRAGAILGMPGKIDQTVNGKRLKRGVLVWPVGVSIAKHEFYGQLGLERPTAESDEPYPPGYVHLNQYMDEDRIRQLASEHLVTRVVKGFKRLDWVKVEERNEALDCRVYARAAAAQVGIDQMSERQWDHLAVHLGVAAAPKPATAEPVAPAAEPVPAPTAAPGSGSARNLGMRPKGWLRGKR